MADLFIGRCKGRQAAAALVAMACALSLAPARSEAAPAADAVFVNAVPADAVRADAVRANAVAADAVRAAAAPVNAVRTNAVRADAAPADALPADAPLGAAVNAPALAEPPALRLPVVGIFPTALQDTFNDSRDGGQRGHEAIDILAPLGTPVLAVDDGPIVKLFTSKPGGLTVYQFDASGQFAYYYAHLDGYAEGLAEGQSVRRGSVIGYVGFTGNAREDAPHLHFAIFRLNEEKKWWKGEPLNPFGYIGGKPAVAAVKPDAPAAPYPPAALYAPEGEP